MAAPGPANEAVASEEVDYEAFAGLKDNHKWQDLKLRPYPYKPDDVLPTCPASCLTCSDQYTPLGSRTLPDDAKYPDVDPGVKAWSDEKAAKELQKLVQGAETDLESLCKQIDKYGDGSIKRWEKRGAKKRMDLLRSAWPFELQGQWREADIEFEMARFSGALLHAQALIDAANQSRVRVNEAHHKTLYAKFAEERKRVKKTDLAPFLDLHDLADDYLRLPDLIHYRTGSKPEDWVILDRLKLKPLFHLLQFDELAYNPKCVVMYGENYGKLVPWHREAAHRWDTIGFPLAYQILRAQKKLSEFLLKITEHVLKHEPNKVLKGRSNWDSQAEAGFQGEDESIGQPKLSIPAFAGAPVFKLPQIQDVADSRMDANLQQLMRVQTDALFDITTLKDVENRSRFDKLSNEGKQSVLFEGFFRDQVRRVDLWRFIKGHTLFVQDAQEECKGDIKAGNPLPKKYAKALDEFEAAVILKY